MQSLRNMDEETRELVRELGISDNSVVWEIGTGTGELALGLARFCKQVYATDVSAEMIGIARRKSTRLEAVNTTFEVGGFLSEFQPPEPVDFIVTQLALHHLPDFWKDRALAVIAGKLRDNGRLYLKDIVFPSEIDDYDAFFEQFVEGLRVRAGDETAEETIGHIREEYSTLDWILEGMLERRGLRIIKREKKTFVSVYVCEK